MKLKRYEGNPILSPNPANGWEDLAVFNPAAWYDEDTKQVMLLYRAAEAGPGYDWEAGKLSVNTPPYQDRAWLADHLPRRICSWAAGTASCLPT